MIPKRSLSEKLSSERRRKANIDPKIDPTSEEENILPILSPTLVTSTSPKYPKIAGQ